MCKKSKDGKLGNNSRKRTREQGSFLFAMKLTYARDQSFNLGGRNLDRCLEGSIEKS